MLIRPAIDLYEGGVVRLNRGDYSTMTRYDIPPLQLAQRALDAALRHLHVVDIEGAAKGSSANLASIRKLCSLGGLSVQVGGGIRTRTQVAMLFDAGVERVVIGSSIILDTPQVETWVKEFGTDRFVAAMDLRDGWVAIKGWTEQSALDADSFLELVRGMGITTALCTDIGRDGMMRGPNVELYAELLRRFPAMRFIASGGISSIDDLMALRGIRMHETVIGRALLEGSLTFDELQQLSTDQ